MTFVYNVSDEFKRLGVNNSIVAELTGLSVQNSHSDLEKLKQAAVAKALALQDTEIHSNPILESYRELVRRQGRSLKKFPPAAENLLGQVRRTQRMPNINTVVDAYNIVVLERYLALGVHDAKKLTSPISFRISQGGEPFRPVGSADAKATQAGDYVYSDPTRVLAWLDSRDSDEVKVGLETTDIMIVIQGTHVTTRDYNCAAAEEACRLITTFCGGSFEIAELR
jgi:DNA/RNA-binding domain of Phe-tRNA-synthetase-like protein